jgi:hypothetical protein
MLVLITVLVTQCLTMRTLWCVCVCVCIQVTVTADAQNAMAATLKKAKDAEKAAAKVSVQQLQQCATSTCMVAGKPLARSEPLTFDTKYRLSVT